MPLRGGGQCSVMPTAADKAPDPPSGTAQGCRRKGISPHARGMFGWKLQQRASEQPIQATNLAGRCSAGVCSSSLEAGIKRARPKSIKRIVH